jgi:phospholipid/cholesterol/gamma-HCH transport system substrate-binding protein
MKINKIALIAISIIVFIAGAITINCIVNQFRYYSVYVNFSQSAGIIKNDKVRYLGVDIGQIQLISIIDNHADIKVKIKKSVKIPKGSSLSIGNVGLFGEKCINILPSHSVDYYLPNDTIKGNEVDTIPNIQKASAFVNTVSNLGSLVMEKQILEKLDTVITLLKAKK